MKFRFVLILFALGIFSCMSVFAQGYVLNGSGARAAGMGYAFTAMADDATAISWNAAGLTQLSSPEASVVARLGFGSLDPDYSDIDLNVETGSKFQLNFASIVVPFSAGNINIVGGVAYRRVYDFTSDFTITASDADFEIKNENSGGVDAITPAIGVQINEMISVGAAFNIFVGSTDYMYEANFGGLTSEDEYSEEYSGTAIDLGVLVKPSPQFSIGANLSLPHTVKITEKMEGFDDFEYDLEPPFSFSIGAAFRASDQVTIAADYRSRPWSNLKIDGEEFDSDNQPEDANSIHVGLEYLAQAGNSVLPIRVGFFTLPTPDVDYKGDQISYNGLTAGIGVIMGNIILDGSFEWVFGSYVGDENFIDGSDVDYNINDFRITFGGVVHFGKK